VLINNNAGGKIILVFPPALFLFLFGFVSQKPHRQVCIKAVDVFGCGSREAEST